MNGKTNKRVELKTAIGKPRSSTAQTSEMVPPTLVKGAEEARPAIIRPANMVAMFLARQLGKVKRK